MYTRNKLIVFSYFSFSSHAFCFVYINLLLCWNHQLVVWVLHMNKLLSIQDRVSGWGQSFVHPFPPPPIEHIVDHMGRQAYVSFCLATSVWKVVKTFFSHLFPFAFSSCSFICSQCGESTLDKLTLNTSYVILLITIKLKWLWAFPIAIFTHMASVS